MPTVVEFLKPEQQAQLSPEALAEYVEAMREQLREKAAANGGICVCRDCEDKVDDTGFLCRKHRNQFNEWNYMLPDHMRQWEFYTARF